MAKISIVVAEGKGVLETEVLWLQVIEDASLEYFVLCDSTYASVDRISNKLRHVFWFPTLAVKKGDYVAVFTRTGANVSVDNNKGSKTHKLYWGLKETVWNKTGDCAVIFPISGWIVSKV